MRTFRRICVYCGSNTGGPAYIAAAKAFFTRVFGWTWKDWGPEYADTQSAGLACGLTQVSEARPLGTLVVLYAKTSQLISDYGRAVGAHYKRCVTNNDVPTPLALESFDPSLERTAVEPPPTDFTLPRGGFPMAVRPY